MHRTPTTSPRIGTTGGSKLVRERDEKRVVWDLREHGAIDHGYARTSYRSRGRTVDSVLALASSVEERRGLYVDVTRAREKVTIAYGKDEVRDFGELLSRAQRDQGKMLVSDVERVVCIRVVREQERERELQWQRELRRDRAPVIEQPLEGPKIDRDRDRSRGWGMGR